MTTPRNLFLDLYWGFWADYVAQKVRLYLAVRQNISFRKSSLFINHRRRNAHLNMKNYPQHKPFLSFQRKVTQASERDLKYQVESLKNCLSEID